MSGTAPAGARGKRRNRDLNRFWTGDAMAQFAAMMGLTTLPLLALQVLHADARQMGLLTAAETIGFAVLGFPAGVWIGRSRKRGVLVTANLVRAAALVSIPAGWLGGWLTMPQLLVAVAVAGGCAVFYELASESFLPVVVGRDDLVEANSKIQSTQPLAFLLGPLSAGGLAQLLGPVAGVVPMVAGHLASAWSIQRVAVVERRPPKPPVRHAWREVARGWRFLAGDAALAAIARCSAVCNFFMGVELAVLALFLVRDAGFSGFAVGVLFACGGLGGLLGAATTPLLVRRLGQARALWLGPLVAFPFGVLIPLAALGGVGVPLAAFGYALVGLAGVAYNINETSYRQAVCPADTLDMVNAIMRFLTWGPISLGGLAGGFLGGAIGATGTLWAAVLGALAGPVFLLLSPLRHGLPLPSATDSR